MQETPNILIVENEKTTRDSIRCIFLKEGYNVIAVANGEEMNDVLSSKHIHLIMMEVDLPGTDGFRLSKLLPKDEYGNNKVPLIFLSKKTNDIDRIVGLEIGADDYITTSCNNRELAARSRNILRRTMAMTKPNAKKDLTVEKYYFNNWCLDVNNHSLIDPNNTIIRLPRSEFRALLHFLENPGKLQTRNELLKKMTGRELKARDRTVDVIIRRIRMHFESIPNTPEFISTIHGEGYWFSGNVGKVSSNAVVQ